MDKLPQELIDEIISSFDRTRPSDHSALLACSRVSRSWRRQAQKELFPHVQFITMDLLRRWDCDIPLESEVPSYVRHLRWAVWPATTERPDPFLESTFPGCFASFSSIETLRVSNLSLRYFDTTAIGWTFSHLSHSLRRLDIDHLTTNPEKWCFLISLLPNLRHIHVPVVTMLEGESPNHPPSFNFAGHIARFGPATEQFFRCIAGLDPRFESLEVRIINNALADTFNLVVRSCSATLTTISITPLTLRMEGNPSRSRLFITNLVRLAVWSMSRLDLSSCSNLRALRMDPEMASRFPEFNCLLQTISSKHFEKLILSLSTHGVPVYWGANDRAFHSFAERLYKLGATKPLTMVLESSAAEEARDRMADFQDLWPLFCEVGIIVEGCRGCCG